MSTPASARPASPLLERTLFALLALAALHIPLVPVSHAADRTALPDLVFCLVIAWVVRRPASAPLWLVLAVGVAADVMLARPPGPGALGLVLASEVVRDHRRALAAAFPLEWLAAAGLAAAVIAGTALLLAVTLAPTPGSGPLVAHWIATAAAYPAVALLVHAALRLGERARP
jgi:rod shape-determining protein MreD